MAAESPLDRIVAEMRATLAQALGSPGAVRTCAIVVETDGEHAGKVIVCSSDSRPWVAKALLQEAVGQIDHAGRP